MAILLKTAIDDCDDVDFPFCESDLNHMLLLLCQIDATCLEHCSSGAGGGYLFLEHTACNSCLCWRALFCGSLFGISYVDNGRRMHQEYTDIVALISAVKSRQMNKE